MRKIQDKEKKKIEEKLFSQSFRETVNWAEELSDQQRRARTYAEMENGIAALSDVQMQRTYLYYGKLAETLGLGRKGQTTEIESIWEDEIFSMVHPDDLLEKQLVTAALLEVLEKVKPEERMDYIAVSRMRMRDKKGNEYSCLHRQFYSANGDDDSMLFFFCVYSLGHAEMGYHHSCLVNTATGEVTLLGEKDVPVSLTKREREVLKYVSKGWSSKEIAFRMCISPFTVSRHRQNILQKLKARNVSEAITKSRVGESVS